MEIKIIDASSVHLKKVRELWYSNRTTLGFFPEGAFLDYAKRKQILVAIDVQGHCTGYLIYRISKSQIIVVHLCVDLSVRGKGIAKQLITYLNGITKSYWGIGLRCRRDYATNNMWPKLGFTARADRPGRSFDGKPLTFWWIEHGHPSLFSFNQADLIQSNTVVVMDANVFYDLQSAEDPENEESKSLLADWLPDTLTLCLTEEIYNEINRTRDEKEREKWRSFVSLFTVLTCPLEEHQTICSDLRPYFPTALTPSDESDLRQLSRAICCGAHYFVTRDSGLLNIADRIYEKCGMNMVRPCDLITRIDELMRSVQYQPARLAGSLISVKLVSSGHESLLGSFQNFSLKESKADFQRNVRRFLANPTIYETRIVTDAEKQCLAIMVFCRANSNLLEIPMFRVAKGTLGSTLARHLILKAIVTSAKENRPLTKVADNFTSLEILSALTDSGFTMHNNEWKKLNIKMIDKASSVATALDQLRRRFPDESHYLLSISDELVKAQSMADIMLFWKIEKALWPLKILDSGVPTYIVPIKPKWAAELFDEQMACQNLYGASPELALNCENAYYRAKRPKVLSAPGRILWYVSKAKKFTDTMSIKACSYLDDVVVGKPKELYQLFRRLGVYQWADVYREANCDCDREIMAVDFSNTELFDVPIGWTKLQQILGREAPIQSPVRVSDEQFADIYRLGFRKEEGC